MISVKKSGTYVDCILDPFFLEFLDLSFQLWEKPGVKVAIKSFAQRARFRVAILKKVRSPLILVPGARKRPRSFKLHRSRRRSILLNCACQCLSGARGDGGYFLGMERIHFHLEETSRLLKFSLKWSCEYWRDGIFRNPWTVGSAYITIKRSRLCQVRQQSAGACIRAKSVHMFKRQCGSFECCPTAINRGFFLMWVGQHTILWNI